MGEPLLHSFRRLADVAGRSHTTVQSWCQHVDWPFSRTPPWPAHQAIEMLAWSEENLREDRSNRERPSRKAPEPTAADPTVKLTAYLPVRRRDVIDPRSPWCPRRFVGPRLFRHVTVADLDDYAGAINFAIGAAMIDVSKAAGEDGISEEAPTSYYDKLLNAAFDTLNAPAGPGLLRYLNVCTTDWILRRFKGRKRFAELVAEYEETPAPATEANPTADAAPGSAGARGPGTRRPGRRGRAQGTRPRASRQASTDAGAGRDGKGEAGDLAEEVPQG